MSSVGTSSSSSSSGSLFSMSGLISGLDWDTLIKQLVAVERQPETKLSQKISTLTAQKTAIKELKTQLTTLRSRLQDFRFNNIFDSYSSTTSEDTVLTSSVSGTSAAVGSYVVKVTQLASATVANSDAAMSGSVNAAAALNSSGLTTTVEAGTFTINGVAFTVDPTTDSLNTILSRINASSAGVTATYDSATDKVVLTNTAANDTNVINLGASDDDSNFLAAIGVSGATQSTGSTGSTTLTSTQHLGALNDTGTLSGENLANGTITAGTFSINGVTISVDPSADSLTDVLERINSSDAGVSASYDSATDTIRVLSSTLGSRTIKFGSSSDTSNFLSITNLDSASQVAGQDAQFTINGGSTLTRNTNQVSDAITGVTINLLSTGTSTVTVSSDDDAIVTGISNFVTEFNSTITKIADLTGSSGDLAGDSGIASISDYLFQQVFSQVSGSGDSDYDSLLAIGISTGSDFSADTTPQLEVDEDKLRAALEDNRSAVQSLFTNSSSTGIVDTMYDYVNSATSATGWLNQRVKSNGTIDQQITSLNAQIDRIEERVSLYETRLKKQYSALETMMSSMKAQSSSLSALSSF